MWWLRATASEKAWRLAGWPPTSSIALPIPIFQLRSCIIEVTGSLRSSQLSEANRANTPGLVIVPKPWWLTMRQGLLMSPGSPLIVQPW